MRDRALVLGSVLSKLWGVPSPLAQLLAEGCRCTPLMSRCTPSSPSIRVPRTAARVSVAASTEKRSRICREATPDLSGVKCRLSGGSLMYSKSMSSVSASGTRPLNHLERMTYRQVELLSTRTGLALLPVGPPEAHGPHLPLGTDLIAARELCERATQELATRGVECLLAPLLPYCLAKVAEPFPGTITLRAEVVAALVADICRSLARSGFRHILVVSGHAEEENLAALQAGAEQGEGKGAGGGISMVG